MSTHFFPLNYSLKKYYSQIQLKVYYRRSKWKGRVYFINGVVIFYESLKSFVVFATEKNMLFLLSDLFRENQCCSSSMIFPFLWYNQGLVSHRANGASVWAPSWMEAPKLIILWSKKYVILLMIWNEQSLSAVV